MSSVLDRLKPRWAGDLVFINVDGKYINQQDSHGSDWAILVVQGVRESDSRAAGGVKYGASR